MNEDIIAFLNEYIKNPNPQYAVLITGQWGCGKTFFIKKWLDSLKKEDNDTSHVIRKPIYVSLYGLNSIGAINKAIEREVKPWLYSKEVFFAKKIVKAIGKATIRYDFDIDGDKENAHGGQLSYTLDIMSLFNDKEKENPIKGEKVLVFDDLERCPIDIEEVLGYINYFVEHSECKVIVIGDTSKLNHSEETFRQYKEKLFGREFSVNPDTDSAISSFIEKIGRNRHNQLKRNINLIKKIFDLSGKSNLRIVRQALYDYNQCIGKVSDLSKKDNYSSIAKMLLCNFLITYLEYKTGNKVYEEWQSKHFLSYFEKDDNTFAFKEKYYSLQSEVNVFEDNLISCIMDYMLKGNFDDSYLKTLLMDEKDKKPWQILHDYWKLDDNDFNRNYNATLKALEEDSIETIGETISAIVLLLTIDANGIVKVDKDNIICILQNRIFMYLGNITDQTEFYEAYRQICTSIQYLKPINSTLQENILKSIQDYFNKRKRNFKYKTTLFFETISNDTVGQLRDLLQESLPDRSREYNMGAIFVDVDIEKCVKSILQLNNASRIELLGILTYHYNYEVLRPVNAIDFIFRYQDDITQMLLISEKLFSEISNYKLITAATIKELANYLKETSQKMDELLKRKLVEKKD